MKCNKCSSKKVTTICYPSEGDRKEYICRDCGARWSDRQAPTNTAAGDDCRLKRLSKSQRRALRRLQRTSMNAAVGRTSKKSRGRSSKSRKPPPLFVPHVSPDFIYGEYDNSPGG